MTNNKKYKWIDLSKLEVGSPEYIKAVYKKYNIQSYEDYRKDIVQQHRKEELLKLDTSLINKYFIKQNINAYENKLKRRDYEISTGVYASNRDENYKKNYIKCLEDYGIHQAVIDVVKTVPAVNFNLYFPPLKDYYIYVLGRAKSKGGNVYRIDLGLQDDFLIGILDTLLIINYIDQTFYDVYSGKKKK